MIVQIRSIFCSLLYLSALNGCISSSLYPDDWPEPVTFAAASAAGCSDLSGAYNNRGVSSDADSVVLAALFFPVGINESMMVHYELEAVSHFTFEHLENSEMLLRAWVGEEFYRERLITADDLPCAEGRNVFHDVSWHAGGIAPFLPIVGRSSVDRWLSPASDGSLVMENREVAVGAALVVPVGIKARYWYRFTPVTEATFDFSDPSMPKGVRSPPALPQHLEPPDNAEPWTGYGDAQACVDRAVSSKGVPDPRSATLLNGQSTQRFLLQNGPEGALMPSGKVDGNNWLPSTHELRIEKLNWQLPAIADNYILCLLDKGYRLGSS